MARHADRAGAGKLMFSADHDDDPACQAGQIATLVDALGRAVPWEPLALYYCRAAQEGHIAFRAHAPSRAVLREAREGPDDPARQGGRIALRVHASSRAVPREPGEGHDDGPTHQEAPGS